MSDSECDYGVRDLVSSLLNAQSAGETKRICKSIIKALAESFDSSEWDPVLSDLGTALNRIIKRSDALVKAGCKVIGATVCALGPAAMPVVEATCAKLYHLATSNRNVFAGAAVEALAIYHFALVDEESLLLEFFDLLASVFDQENFLVNPSVPEGRLSAVLRAYALVIPAVDERWGQTFADDLMPILLDSLDALEGAARSAAFTLLATMHETACKADDEHTAHLISTSIRDPLDTLCHDRDRHMARKTAREQRAEYRVFSDYFDDGEFASTTVEIHCRGRERFEIESFEMHVRYMTLVSVFGERVQPLLRGNEFTRCFTELGPVKEDASDRLSRDEREMMRIERKADKKVSDAKRRSARSRKQRE